MQIEIIPAYQEIERIRTLFREYTDFLGVNLDFQNYAEEYANLPGKYAPPRGRLYLALCDGKPAGCVALRPFDENRCEVKRLYVKPEFQGLKIGRALMEKLIADAHEMNYKSMILDTHPRLVNGLSLYRKLGFKKIEKYYPNPYPETIYLGLDL